MACTCIARSPSAGCSTAGSGSTPWGRWRLRAGLVALAIALGVTTTAGCADTRPAIQYSAAQLLGMWNDSMRGLADQHAGCPYERDLPFNHAKGACYPLKCKNSGEEVALLRKHDGTIYKCDSGCDGGCGSVARN